MSASVGVRLVSIEDVAAITALVAQNLEFLAPWDPARDADYPTEPVQRRLISEALERHDAALALPLVITTGDEIVGRINIADIVRGPFRSAHLGYWVSEPHTGRGVASAAVAATASLAYGPCGLHRLQAATLVHNVGSQRVLARNGFTLIGLAPSYLQIAGRWQDHLLFQRVAPASSAEDEHVGRDSAVSSRTGALLDTLNPWNWGAGSS